MLKKVMTLICFCCYLCFMQIGFAQDIIKQETPQTDIESGYFTYAFQ